ncbi:ras guanine nucleotide exchange factor domain-containing protein [Cercophora scortea]|uniref:Ras guanine nucleotide exchange factor domain-containing protein n=1 Tax=Cercophora scortea TaxID=314031 RepID=A0AAE0M6A1_9PEZI|nr:ras guanine nucleotide exchange factor domain-containing protein [Cercophora scortea]
MRVQTHQRVADRERERDRERGGRDRQHDNGGGSKGLQIQLTSPHRSRQGSAFRTGGPASAPPPPSAVVSEGTFLLVDDPPAANVRDSFSSIVDDPFFLRYDIVTVAPAPAHAPSSSTAGPPRHDPQQLWLPPRKESLTLVLPRPAPPRNGPMRIAGAIVEHKGTKGLTIQLSIQFERSNSTMEAINLAVIGADGVGKSSFIQRAMRLPQPPGMNVTALREDIDGTPYLVTLVELDLEAFTLDPGQSIQWPKQINGHMVPRMDAAMILYDVGNAESIQNIPPTMTALAHSSLPAALVATKCDAPESLRRLDTADVASKFPASVINFKTSANIPGSARECLHSMLRAAVATRRGGSDKSEGGFIARRRAASTANLDAPPDTINGRPISQNSKHSRASSDFSLLRGFPPPANEGYHRGPPSRSPRLEYQIHAPGSNQNINSDGSEDGPSQTVSSMLRTPGIRLDGGAESFLDIEESDAESYRYSDDIPILQRNDDNFLERPARVAGVTFDELVDRLIAPRMTRADNNFADIFLCLYRKFAAPSELLSAILVRRDRVKNDRTAQFLTKIGAQMRIIEVVAKWLSLYPGDFARPATKRNLEGLIKQLAAEDAFSAAAQQMRTHLEQKVVEDDDTGWAKCDEIEEDTAGMPSRSTGRGKDVTGRGHGELASSMSSLQLEEPGMPDQRRPSQGSDQSGLETHAGPALARFQFHSFEDYEREAATMEPRGTLPLNKIRYHCFMDLDPDEIAEEITRIDWVMFSSIRIRDMVRHVSLPSDQKDKCRSLHNVDRMVSHFNHVAKWVANMVLIRDKAKHRAPCLEKFMYVALKLRQLNDYNGLAAVLAGINGTAVHRLVQTRALVSAEVQKRFARLVLLMGTQKSHFAYRLAWENSPLPRIPFMPLHRRDLVSAEEGSRTFVGPNGDRINWKKYEVLGEVLLPIMKSQGQPYPDLKRHELARELILDCRIATDEEDIYQRSLQVEPSTGSAAESSKKKFPWLAK